MSYDFWYDDQREVLVFKFPDDHISITYYLNQQFKMPQEQYPVWLKVQTVKGSYPMRSYAFQFFQRCFRRIKCDRAKWEAKKIIRHVRQSEDPSKKIIRLLAAYEKTQKEAIEKFATEV